MTDTQSHKKRHWKHRRGPADSAGVGVAPRAQHSTASTNDNRQGHVQLNGLKRSWESHDSGRHNHQESRHNRHSNQRQLPHRGNSGSRRSHLATSSRPVVPETTLLESSVAVAPEPVIREIPGFYFDTEKKKYFKITENHVFGNQHPFSRQSINEKLAQKPVLDPIKKRNGSRFPSRTTRYGRLDWFLQDCQLGKAGRPQRQLCETHALLVSRWRRNKTLEPQITGHGANYKHLQIDSVGGSLYLGSIYGELWQHLLPNDPWDKLYQWMQLNTGESSEMTSFHKTPDDYLISTYLGSMGRSGVLKIHKKEQEESTRFSFGQHSLSLVFEHSPSPKTSSFWTSAYGDNSLAIGADQKALVIRDWRSGSHETDTLWTGSDVFSLAIEPLGGQNVVYAGCRNGSVRIFDLLQPATFAPTARSKKQARSSALFPGIGHKNSSVHCIRRVSDHYLVTAAMNGEISMWDTRFVKGSVSNPQAKSVLDFRGFVKDQFSSTTFDINEGETLLAADNIEQQVSLWSMSTGDRVRDLDVAGPVSCLKFAGDHRLWATGQDCVQSWGIE